MKKTNLVKEIGSSDYLKYNRANTLNFLTYSRSVSFNAGEIIESIDFKTADKMLKSKLPSYYIAKHSGFKSIAEYLNGSPVVELSSTVSDVRRSFDVKPASWFKVEDAFNILKIIKSKGGTKVLDPFHGWGARLVAAKMLAMPYVGVDANKLLHNELLRTFPDEKGLVLGDAFSFDYSRIDFDCVFTCPPYWQCEDYGYRVKNFSSYDKFLGNLCDLFIGLSDKARVQIVSLESFVFKGKKYEFDLDFKNAMSSHFSVEEIVYREMPRSFNGDIRKLKCFVLTNRVIG